MTVPYTFAYSTGDVALAELDANFASVANNVSSANTARTVTGNAQANITSVGVLTSLSSSGNITANLFIGNLVGYADSAGNAVFATAAGAANTAGQSTFANIATVAATVTTNAQPNITSVGTLISLDVTGNITADYFVGNIVGSIANAVYANTAGSANTAATVTTNAQPNITSVGTLTSLSSSGNINSGNLNLTGGVVAEYVESNSGVFAATGDIYGNNIIATTAFQLPVYANTTARDTAISSPSIGMLVVVGNTYQGYNGITWGNISLS